MTQAHCSRVTARVESFEMHAIQLTRAAWLAPLNIRPGHDGGRRLRPESEPAFPFGHLVSIAVDFPGAEQGDGLRGHDPHANDGLWRRLVTRIPIPR
jgi:hypothetical protein